MNTILKYMASGLLRRNIVAALSLVILLLNQVAFTLDEAKMISICIAPLDLDPDFAATHELFCGKDDISLKIGSRPRIPWPKKNMKLEGLDPKSIGCITVYYKDKPQQSFRFTFSYFKTTELCLFVNGFYKTVQLKDVKDSPRWYCNRPSQHTQKKLKSSKLQ